MNNLSKQLKDFERRVRLVRAWRGLAIGACIGTGLSTIWAVLDWRSVLYTEWLWMGLLTGFCALVGMIVGATLKIPITKLAQSIDRRAGLDDRLTTAQERFGEDESFDQALSVDAAEKLASVRPTSVYPIRFGRWHAGALGLALVAAAIFVLGNTPIVLSEQARKDRQDLKKEGELVKRVTKENFETPEAKQEISAEEKRLADQLRSFNRDLEKAHLSKEEALQKSNELSKKADDLMKSAAKESQQSLAEAQTAREQMEKGALEQAGIDNVSPQMAEMPDGLRQSKMDDAKRQGKKLEDQLNALKQKLDELNRKLANKNLTAEERKALEAQKKEVEKQINQLKSDLKSNQDLQKQLELSKEAQEVFRKMAQDPIFKEMMELEKKLAANSKSANDPASGRPKLTDAERQEIKRRLEELAAKLKDAKEMKKYLEAMLEALKKANKLGRCNGIGLGINGMLSLGGTSLQQAPAGPGAPSEDIWMGDSGHIHKLDKAVESKGTTTTDVISGQQRPSSGPQPYVEIRAPSLVGNRTSVPYREVLPSYERKAESALNRQQIPKEHQRRVKEYFDSLTGNHKN